MSSTSARITTKQLKAVSLMIAGETFVAIAEALGVSSRTVRRWSVLPEIQQAVQQGKGKAVDTVVEAASDKYKRVVEALIPKALVTLRDTLGDSEARTSDKLRACQILGKWYGLEKAATFVQAETQPQPEENLKSYLEYLATTKNGNGKH